MSYKVDYNAMHNLLGAYNSTIAEWSEGISCVVGKETAIEASTSISGNKASRMKQYLNTTYSCAKDSFAMLIEMFRQKFLLYTDTYYQQIDSARDTFIEEKELSDIRSELQGKKAKIQQISLQAENEVQPVSDLVSVPSLDVSDLDAEIVRILTSLDDLNDGVNALESAHVSSDFADIDALISKLDAFLVELIGQSKEFKTNFSVESFAALSSVPGLIAALHEAYDQFIAQESDVELAAKHLEKRLEQEREEYEKRKKQAEWAKIGVNILIGAISAVAIATTGPLGAVAVGAIGGAVSAAFSASADEYVEHGWNTQSWDVNRIVIHGSIGGITGAVSGLVGGYFPGAGPCVKAGIKGLGSAFEGVVSTSYDQIKASGRITDVGGIVQDALLKGGSTFVGSYIGSTVSDHVSDFVKQNKTIEDLSEHVAGGGKHFGAVLQVEGASGIASGMAKRFSSTAVTETGGFVSSIVSGKSITEAYDEHRILSKSFEKAIDPKSIVGDVGSAVSSAATDDPVRDSLKKLDRRPDDYYLFGDSPDLSGNKDGWKDWNSEEYDRMMQKLADMDARGDDARNYELFGDPRSFSAQRSAAVNDAWEQERRLVMQGRGTRDWTISQQEELIRTGKVSGFDGSHMLDASSNPSVANSPDNIQFLTYEEHIYGAHAGNTHNPTTGHFDPATGKTETINPRQIPHRESVAFELSQKFDYTQLDLADQLGAPFGYDRGNK